MKISWKHAFYVGGFLAILTGVLGLAIAGGDLITRDIIVNNKTKKEEAGVTYLFGQDVTYDPFVEIRDADYPTLTKYCTVNDGDAEVGRVYASNGANAYGEVALLIAIYADTFALGNVYTITNTESYAATLEDGYLLPYQQSDNKEAAVYEVSCGATYGAKLCRDMILSAQAHYQGGAK